MMVRDISRVRFTDAGAAAVSSLMSLVYGRPGDFATFKLFKTNNLHAFYGRKVTNCT